MALGVFPGPMGRAGRTAGPLGWTTVARARWPSGRPAAAFARGPSHTVGPNGCRIGRPRVGVVRGFPARTGHRPAQRASRSPSQGRRPWWLRQQSIRPNGPTVPRTTRASRRIVGPLGRNMAWSVLPGPMGRARGMAGPLGRSTDARARWPSGPGTSRVVCSWPFTHRWAERELGPNRRGLAWFVVFRPERAIVRPNGPAVPPARVVGPGSSRQHTVRPNGPTVPTTTGATRRIVGPLGRIMSLSAFPGPMGRAGGTAGPLGRLGLWRWPFTYRWAERLGFGVDRGFSARMGRRPAQRAGRSPSQGRRPWWRASRPVIDRLPALRSAGSLVTMRKIPPPRPNA